MTMTTLIKDNIQLGLAYGFRGLVHYHHGGRQDRVQADMMLEKELGLLQTDSKAAEDTYVLSTA